MKKIRPLFIVLLALSIFILLFMFFDQFKNKDKLAKKNLIHRIFEVGYVSDLSDSDKQRVFSSYSELEHFLRNKEVIKGDEYGDVAHHYNEDILKIYDKTFFENKNLAIVYVNISNSSLKLKVNEVYSEANKIVVRYDVKANPGQEVGATVMNGFFITIPSSKQIDKVIIK